MKKILLSGVKPTGQAHIGNYFGAMKQFVDLQNSSDYECYFMIADYHALNLIQNKEEMSNLIKELTLDYLAIGLDPKKSVIFKQSDISAHTELAWIFDTIVTVPYLQRAHAFKDAEAKNKEINVGTFNYPVLMASDILLYNTDVVPVGQDQKQHVEYARDIAEKFNHIYGGPKDSENKPTLPVFRLPEPIIIENVSVVPGIDGKKMSKSHNNTIPLFASREEIQRLVMSIVTDSTGDVPTNVYNMHRLLKSEQELAPIYEANKGKYKALKEALVEDLDAFIKPIRERREKLSAKNSVVNKVLAKGAKRARKMADSKLEQAKIAIGVRD
jgi:tryptophanyl-tRNA synthetase